MHFDVPKNIYIHICGTDLVRDRDGSYLVLEDNARCPSRFLCAENRQAMKRVFPSLRPNIGVRPVEDYSQELLNVLRYIAPAADSEPTVVLLTPEPTPSLFREFFSSRAQWIEIVRARSRRARGKSCMRTTKGLSRVDFIYRRINDDFLDPRVFRKDSGRRAWIGRSLPRGNVSLANSIEPASPTTK